MDEFIDAIELFIGIARGLDGKEITLNSPLERMVIGASQDSLAYVDNRKMALELFGFDFWARIKEQFEDQNQFLYWLQNQGVNRQILYSKSEQFPDFIFKIRNRAGKIVGGSLLELKDSKGGSIASFNSTLPSTYKSLEEIDVVNGNRLVSRIASILDNRLALEADYYTLQRRNYYLVRTHRNSEQVKVSIVDGSFFETVPKEHLIYQMFLNILKGHLEKKDIHISQDLLREIEGILSCVTDQTIIASSQAIEKASIRPRLRIMSEVHAEGNPHSHFYPEITERSLTLILHASALDSGVTETVRERVDDVEIEVFLIQHKRNGNHVVFQFKV